MVPSGRADGDELDVGHGDMVVPGPQDAIKLTIGRHLGAPDLSGTLPSVAEHRRRPQPQTTRRGSRSSSPMSASALALQALRARRPRQGRARGAARRDPRARRRAASRRTATAPPSRSPTTPRSRSRSCTGGRGPTSCISASFIGEEIDTLEPVAVDARRLRLRARDRRVRAPRVDRRRDRQPGRARTSSATSAAASAASSERTDEFGARAGSLVSRTQPREELR